MRLVRFTSGGSASYGVLDGDAINELEGEPFYNLTFTGKVFQLSAVELLAPAAPRKIVLVGLNYSEHAKEIGQETPVEPLIFLKPPSSIIGPDQAIVLPEQSSQVEIEVELALVIGKAAKDISEAEAPSHILGYTIANDVTARDLQFTDLQWARSKAFDTFCPLGPWIETDFDPSDKRLVSSINEIVRQNAPTSDMIFAPAALVSYISQNMTLEPGDVVLTGSPHGISKIVSGDSVECSIDGIGTLRSFVK